MSGLSAALNAGKLSLYTNQKLIEITSTNVSNVNTPGYSRQHAELTDRPALEVGGFFVGQGAVIASITREHDTFITNQLQEKNAALGEESGKALPLSELERIFNVSDNSLATQIDSFFDAWQQLSTNPGGSAERDAVLQQGSLLASAFAKTAQDLDDIKLNINHDLEAKLSDINVKLADVADLNSRISTIEASGQSANALRDRREQTINELSKSLGVKTYEGSNGMLTVALPGGLPLVQGGQAATLIGTWTGQDYNLQLQFGNNTADIGASQLGGEFRGLAELRDTTIADLKDGLDAMAYTLVQEVNTQHEAGVGLDGAVHDFFTPLASADNASRLVGVAIQDSDQIAAGASDASGDNSNALLIAALRNKKVLNGNKDSLIEAYGKMTSDVGLESSQNQLAEAAAQDGLTQLENLREGISGVSIDQEMINLIQYQNAFEASSKLISTIDEMMDSLINSLAR